jgi:hypothetical protein
MLQAAAACNMLDEETTDASRTRALETAIAVCYARAFTKSTIFTQSTLKRLPEEAFAPKKGTRERELHDMFLTLRNKVYAHTDEESGRVIERLTRTEEGDIATLAYQESWPPFDRVLLDPIRDLCQKQVESFRLEAARILHAIDAAGAQSWSGR